VLLMGCTESARQQEVRWPGHRKLEEKRLADLEAYVQRLTPQLQALEQRVKELEVARDKAVAVSAADPL